MNCAEALRVQAYFDGELDADEAASVQQHLAGCAGCRRIAGRSRAHQGARCVAVPRRARAARTARADQYAARRRVASRSAAARAIAQPGAPARSGSAHSRASALSAAAAGAHAVRAAAGGVRAAGRRPAGGASAFARSRDHLIAIVSSERHTVKPWFAGRADVSPTVARFQRTGIPARGRPRGRVVGPARSGHGVSARRSRHQRVRLARNQLSLPRDHDAQRLSTCCSGSLGTWRTAPCRIPGGASSRTRGSGAGAGRRRTTRRCRR